MVRRDNIGDMVCTTPLLSALRAQYPLAWIGVLANTYNAPILEGNPDVDQVCTYRKLKHVDSGISFFALAHKAMLLWRLRRRQLDLVVLATGAEDSRGARLARFLAPKQTLVSDRIQVGMHEVERTFSAARSLGIEGPIPPLRITADEASLGRVRQSVALADLASKRPLIGIHISARRPAQRWSADRFAELSVALYEDLGATTMLFWSPGAENRPQHPGDDEKASTIIERTANRRSLVPWPTARLQELVAGIAACDAVICSDGGAMHIAAGLGKPIVCFFGDSPVDRWRPYGTRHIVLQARSRIVADISLEETLASTTSLIMG